MRHTGLITFMVLSVTVACGDQLPPDPADFNFEVGTADDLHGELVQLARDGAFFGVVLVAEGEEVVFRRAYGVAERRSMRPILPETRFDIGSIGKLFTSVAILRLAQEGCLELDDPVVTHIDALGSDLGGRITVRHLLRHRSGLGDYLATRTSVLSLNDSGGWTTIWSWCRARISRSSPVRRPPTATADSWSWAT